MQQQQVEEFQQRFRDWLGPEPEEAVRVVAHLSGYSLDYVRWAAGLIGKKPWPGSGPFVDKMAELGCTAKPWRDRSPEELLRAFRSREAMQAES